MSSFNHAFLETQFMFEQLQTTDGAEPRNLSAEFNRTTGTGTLYYPK